MNKLVIIGAGGHGKAVADNALKNGYTDIFFVDDNATGTCMGFPIIGKCQDLTKLNDGQSDFIIGIGNNKIRQFIAETYDVNWVSLIHPSAQIAVGTTIGKGSVVMASAVVNVCSVIGEHCIINTGAIVEHDNTLQDYVHISPRATLGGTVHIGENTHIAIGVTVRNDIDICDNCIIGAGAVVVKNIMESGTYIGIPARKK